MMDTETTYNRDAFEAAMAKLTGAPAALTPDDLAQLDVIDPTLAADARAAHGKATASTARPPRWIEWLPDAIVEGLRPALAARDERLRQVEARLAALEERQR